MEQTKSEVFGVSISGRMTNRGKVLVLDLGLPAIIWAVPDPEPLCRNVLECKRGTEIWVLGK